MDKLIVCKKSFLESFKNSYWALNAIFEKDLIFKGFNGEISISSNPRIEKKNTVCLTLRGNNKLYIYENYRVLTQRGFVLAKELTENDFIIRQSKWGSTSIRSKEISHTEPEYFRIKKGREKGTISGRFMPMITPKTTSVEFMKLMGMMIALCRIEDRGTKGLFYTIPKKTDKVVFEEFVRLHKNVFNLTIEDEYNLEGDREYKVYSKNIVKFLKTYLGYNKKLKKINKDIYNAPIEEKKAFCEGLTARYRKGTTKPSIMKRQGVIIYVAELFRIAKDIQTIFSQVGYYTEIKKDKESKDGKPKWRIVLKYRLDDAEELNFFGFNREDIPLFKMRPIKLKMMSFNGSTCLNNVSSVNTLKKNDIDYFKSYYAIKITKKEVKEENCFVCDLAKDIKIFRNEGYMFKGELDEVL